MRNFAGGTESLINNRDMKDLNINAEMAPLSRESEERLSGGYAVLQSSEEEGLGVTNGRRCTNGRCDDTHNGRLCKNEISCAGATNDRRCSNTYERF